MKVLDYANKPAVENNPISMAMYILGYYVAISAAKLKITPDQLTWFSLALTIFSVISLHLQEPLWFAIFWGIAYLLDFADGTLARMTNKIGSKALRVDHMMDLIKISLIFAGFGVYYNELLIWLLSFSAATGYLFYTLLNHELDWVWRVIDLNNTLYQNDIFQTAHVQRMGHGLLYRIAKKTYLITRTTFLTIYGQTLMIFFLISMNKQIAYAVFTYFIGLVGFQSFLRLRSLNRLPKT